MGLEGHPGSSGLPAHPGSHCARPLCGDKGWARGDPQARQTQAHPSPGKALSPTRIPCPGTSSTRFCSALQGRRKDRADTEQGSAQMHLSSQPSGAPGAQLLGICLWLRS